MFYIGLKMTVYGRNMLPWCDLTVYIISLYWYIVVYRRYKIYYTNSLLHNGLASAKLNLLHIVPDQHSFTKRETVLLFPPERIVRRCMINMIDTFPLAVYFSVLLNLIQPQDRMKAKCSSKTAVQTHYTAPYEHPQDHRLSNTCHANPDIIWNIMKHV